MPGRVAASGSAAAEECARQVGGENTPLLGSRKAQTTVATRKGVSWILATQFFHLEKGGKIKKKGTARYPTQAAREEPAPSPPAPPPAEKDRVTRRIRYTQNSICRRRPLANPRARLYSPLTLRTFCSGVNNSDCPTGSGLLHLGSPVSVSSPAPATAGQPDTYTGLFPGRPATAATPP